MLMSLSFCSINIEGVLGDKCIQDTVRAALGKVIINIDYCFIGINNFAELKYLS